MDPKSQHKNQLKGAFTMTTTAKTGITELTMEELETINGGFWEEAWDFIKGVGKKVFVDPFVDLYEKGKEAGSAFYELWEIIFKN